jgi:hypothetical protein
MITPNSKIMEDDPFRELIEENKIIENNQVVVVDGEEEGFEEF